MPAIPKPLKVSYCTTCKGRLHHLKETLPVNVKMEEGNPNVEFVVLDYGSVDRDEQGNESREALGEWIHTNFPKEIASGRLRYVRTEAPYWQPSHAKNMSYRMASGDVLCALDADNIIGKRFGQWLAEHFRKHPHSIVESSFRMRGFHYLTDGDWLRGIGGRIAMRRQDFYALGGYDETIKAWGGCDRDLAARAIHSGLKRVHIPVSMLGDVVEHADRERWIHSMPEVVEDAKARATAHPIARLNHTLKMREGGKACRVNTDGEIGCGEVSVNFKDKLILKPLKLVESLAPAARGWHARTAALSSSVAHIV